MNPQPKEKWLKKEVEVIPVSTYRTTYLSKGGKKNKYSARKIDFNEKLKKQKL